MSTNLLNAPHTQIPLVKAVIINNTTHLPQLCVMCRQYSAILQHMSILQQHLVCYTTPYLVDLWSAPCFCCLLNSSKHTVTCFNKLASIIATNTYENFSIVQPTGRTRGYMPAGEGAATWKTGCKPDAAATACAWMFFIARFCLPVCSSCSWRCAGGCRYLHGGLVRWHLPCHQHSTATAPTISMCLCSFKARNVWAQLTD